MFWSNSSHFSSSCSSIQKTSQFRLCFCHPPLIRTQPDVKSQHIVRLQQAWTFCLSPSLPQSSNSKNWGRRDTAPNDDINCPQKDTPFAPAGADGIDDKSHLTNCFCFLSKLTFFQDFVWWVKTVSIWFDGCVDLSVFLTRKMRAYPKNEHQSLPESELRAAMAYEKYVPQSIPLRNPTFLFEIGDKKKI